MEKDDLEIILLTYNRKPYLQRTLLQLFSDDSPVRNLQITILDNNSDDGSKELIDEYCGRYSNLIHIVNSRNIGGNANIAKAFEISQKKYLWVICDDDYYDWQNWHYVEAAINFGHDCILTSKSQIRDPQNVSDIIFQLTFLPSGIYKTAILSNDVIRNIFDNISNLFPHLMPAIHVANTSEDFYVIPKDVVINGAEKDKAEGKKPADMTLTRGNNKENLLPVSQNMQFFIGYVNSLILMKKNDAIMSGLRSAIAYKPFKQSLTSIFARVVKKSLKNKKSLNLYYDFACKIPFPQRIILTFFRYLPIYFFINPKGIFVQILNRMTIRLIPFSL